MGFIFVTSVIKLVILVIKGLHCLICECYFSKKDTQCFIFLVILPQALWFNFNSFAHFWENNHLVNVNILHGITWLFFTNCTLGTASLSKDRTHEDVYTESNGWPIWQVTLAKMEGSRKIFLGPHRLHINHDCPSLLHLPYSLWQCCCTTKRGVLLFSFLLCYILRMGDRTHF